MITSIPSMKPHKLLGVRRAVGLVRHLQFRRLGGIAWLIVVCEYVFGMYEQCDGVGLEHRRGVGVQRADTARQNRREEIHERPGDGSLVRPGAGHDEFLEQRLVADAHPLLHVGDFRLRLRAALRRIHQREDGTGDRQHDGGRHEQFDERVARLRLEVIASRS